MVILHQFYQSHYCIRIRWVLGYKNVSFEEVNYTWENIEKIFELTHGKWTQVPVLEWDGSLIFDSPQIARAIETRVHKPPIYPLGLTPAFCDIANTWIDFNVMRTAAKYLVNEYISYIGESNKEKYEKEYFLPVHHMTIDEASKLKTQWEKELDSHWKLLNEALNQRSFIFGEDITYVDFSFASRLKLMEIVANYEIPLQYQNMNRWFKNIKILGKDDKTRIHSKLH